MRSGALLVVAAGAALAACSQLLGIEDPVPGTSGSACAADDNEPNDDAMEATTFVVGSLETSLCSATDVDFFAFEVDTVGATFTVTATATDAATSLVVEDPHGHRIGSDEALAPKLVVTPEELGDYLVVVSGTTAEPYTLEISLGSDGARSGR